MFLTLNNGYGQEEMEWKSVLNQDGVEFLNSYVNCENKQYALLVLKNHNDVSVEVNWKEKLVFSSGEEIILNNSNSLQLSIAGQQELFGNCESGPSELKVKTDPHTSILYRGFCDLLVYDVIISKN